MEDPMDVALADLERQQTQWDYEREAEEEWILGMARHPRLTLGISGHTAILGFLGVSNR